MKEEFRIRLDKIEANYVTETKKVLAELARESNPYKIGDILQDHCQIGKVESVFIKLNVKLKNFSIRYKCKALTKKLTPFKNEKRIDIFLDNVKLKLN